MLSVIIPSYNEESNISNTAMVIGNILAKDNIEFELIFVDDGSADNTWKQISEQSGKNKNVRGVLFSKNFGKDAAIFAGLAHSKGDCCAVIDCDLQHPPEKLLEMYRLWKEGYEVVEGVKASRGDESASYTFSAKLFYMFISKATKVDMSRYSDFKLLDRRAVNALLNLNENGAFFRALSSWVGFKTISVEFHVEERLHGDSKWTTLSLVKYALKNISSFSTTPMQAVTLLGCAMLIISVIFSAISLYQWFAGIALGGFTTVIIIQLFTGSIVMISLGIIGYYIARIFEEVRNRPLYIVSQVCGGDYENSKDIR